MIPRWLFPVFCILLTTHLSGHALGTPPCSYWAPRWHGNPLCYRTGLTASWLRPCHCSRSSNDFSDGIFLIPSDPLEYGPVATWLPIVTPWVVQYELGFVTETINLPIYGPSLLYVDPPSPFSNSDFENLPESEARESSLRQEPRNRRGVRLVQAENDWAGPAIEAVDMMIREGDGQGALESLAHLVHLRKELPSGIYLRIGLLEAMQGAPSDIVVEHFRMAWEAGSLLVANELPGGSASEFLKTDRRVDWKIRIDRLAQIGFEKDHPLDLLALALLLRLEGEKARSRNILEACLDRLPPPLQTVAVELQQ